MHRIALLFFAPIAISLSACSSAPQVNPAVLSAATSRGVAPSTASKMSTGAKLDFSDIRNLVARGVPDDTIIAYLNSTRQVCHFPPEQMANLKSAGADARLLSFLADTQGYYGHPPAPRNGPAMRPAGQYTNSRGYQNEQPFAYNEPAIDGFYDSGYEESLYSPFSFN
ncbi:MAG: hypothetical protein WCG66_04945 [bacterium]